LRAPVKPLRGPESHSSSRGRDLCVLLMVPFSWQGGWPWCPDTPGVSSCARSVGEAARWPDRPPVPEAAEALWLEVSSRHSARRPESDRTL
jgi:hypothetical protein